MQGLDIAKVSAPDLLDRMEQSIYHRNAPMNLTEAEINRYLATTVSGSQKGITSRLAGFDRVALSFRPAQKNAAQSCVAWFQWTSFNLPCTASIEFTLKTREKHLRGRAGGVASLGRLPVFRGCAGGTLIPACRSLCAAFDEEIHALFQMNQIAFQKNKVILEPRFDQQR